MTKWREGGLYVVDHRNSPGITEEQMRAAGISHPGFKAGSFFEAPTKTCAHCRRVVVMNPKRIRERATCKGCDGYLCDACAAQYHADGVCRNVTITHELLKEQLCRWVLPGNLKG